MKQLQFFCSFNQPQNEDERKFVHKQKSSDSVFDWHAALLCHYSNGFRSGNYRRHHWNSHRSQRSHNPRRHGQGDEYGHAVDAKNRNQHCRGLQFHASSDRHILDQHRSDWFQGL